jgi:hypothetical protein
MSFVSIPVELTPKLWLDRPYEVGRSAAHHQFDESAPCSTTSKAAEQGLAYQYLDHRRRVHDEMAPSR